MDQKNELHSNNVDDSPKIRTFQSDIADAIRDQKGSVVKIAVQEQERRQEEGTVQSKQSKRNVIFVIVGFFLLFGAVGIFAYSYLNEKQKSLVPEIPQKKNFISGDHVTSILVPDTTVLKDILLKNISTLDIPVGQIEHMLLVYSDADKNMNVTPLVDLFESFRISPPDGFYYSLEENTYIFGIYQTTEGERFILLKSKVFSNTFSQMLLWEKTLAVDLKELLKIPLGEDEKTTFKDKIIKNEDVRIGVSNEQEVIAYSFFGPRKEFLLITSNTETMESLLGRFTTKLLEQ
jgi:hypothetical protein